MPTAPSGRTDKNAPHRLQGKVPHALGRAAAWGLSGAVFMAAAGRLGSGWHWLLDLMANLAAQTGLAAGALLLWWLIRRRWVLAGVALASLFISLAGVWTPRAEIASENSAANLRVLVYNAKAYNQTPLASYMTIMDSGADVVALSEPTPELLDLLRLPATRLVYPYAWLPDQARGGWRLTLSRWPQRWDGLGAEGWEGARGMALHGATWATIVERPEHPFIFVHTHPISPRTQARWREGNHTVRVALQAIREQLLPLDMPIIVGGDLNSTPSGWRSREIDRSGVLLRCKPMSRPAGTFPASSVWPLTVAIDDVWVSKEVRVIRWRRGDSGGSDHYPVMVDLALPTP